MPAGFDLVTIDSPDPNSAAAFWSAALALHETQREDVDRWIVLSDAQHGRRVGIQRGECRPGSMHLDLRCTIDEFEPELHRLQSLGAQVVAPTRREPYGAIVNLTDPDGNPFDLCAYIDW